MNSDEMRAIAEECRRYEQYQPQEGGSFEQVWLTLADLADQLVALDNYCKGMADEVAALKERVGICGEMYDGYECRLLKGHNSDHEYE
jgi:hypothetical protein